MSKKRYWFVNLVISVIFIIFYVYPSLGEGKWTAALVGSFPPVLIYSGVILFQFSFAWFLLNHKKQIVGFLHSNQKYISNRRFWISLSLLVFILFFFINCKKYLNIEPGIFDFALEEQVVWNTSQGRLFEGSVEVNNYLGDHVSFLILLPALVYMVIPSAFTLIAIQVLCVVLSALAIQKISYRYLRNWWLSLAVYLMYLFYIGLTSPLLLDYRAVVLGMPFLAWGIYFLENPKKQNIGIILLAVGALAKEDMALFVGVIGLYQLLILKKKRGLILAIYGFSLALIGLLIIIPAFRGTDSDTLGRYVGIGGLFLMVPEKIIYIVRLLFPLLFIPILEWKKIWAMLPSLFINLFSVYLGQISAINQYDIATGLVIFWSFISFVKSQKSQSVYLLFALLLIVNVLLLSGHSIRRNLFDSFYRYDDYIFIHEFKDSILPDAVVAATNTIGGQFGQTRNLQIYDLNVMTYQEKPDYILVDKLNDYNENIQDMVQNDLISGNYLIRYETDSILILQAINYQ